MKYSFRTTLKCQGCINTIKPRMDSIKDIKSWSVDLDNPVKILHIDSDYDISESVIDALNQCGFKAEKI